MRNLLELLFGIRVVCVLVCIEWLDGLVQQVWLMVALTWVELERVHFVSLLELLLGGCGSDLIDVSLVRW